MDTTDPPSLPSDIPAPEVFGRGSWPLINLDVKREVGSPAPAFPAWAARQYSQVIAPIHYALSRSSRVSIAEKSNLSRNAVQTALDGASWPQLQTIIRLAHVAGVELFALSGRDLVTHGPPLPPDEQALLVAYRRLPTAARAAVRQKAFQIVNDHRSPLASEDHRHPERGGSHGEMPSSLGSANVTSRRRQSTEPQGVARRTSA